MIKKIVIAMIALIVGTQMIASHSLNVYATSDKQEVNDVNSLKADVVGVDGISEAEIALGEITHSDYEGYTFVNATVQNTVVDYIGVHEGKLYYTNKGKQNFGTFLLNDANVKLNYKKTMNDFTIHYDYDQAMVSVVGPNRIGRNETLTFRLENADGKRVVSVKANDKLLRQDDDGYYTLKNVTDNINVVVKSEVISKYYVTIKNDYANKNVLTGDATVTAGKDWKGTFTSVGETLNSIILNNQYLTIPNGSKNETKASTLSDGTKVSVSVNSEYMWDWGANYKYTYTITVEEVKSDLHFIPTIYNDGVHDITLTSIKGLSVYHWTGTELRQLEFGDIVNKNNSTDVFFVATKAGWEAEISRLAGDGTKIIERLNTVSKIENVPGDYTKAKAAAEAIGCNYVMYYSNKEVKKRTIYIESKLIQYNVKYDGDGTTFKIEDNNTYDIEKNNNVMVSSTVPTKDGYTFMGWMNVDTKAIVQPNEEIRINETLANALTTNTINLKAQWIKNEELKTASYKIQYFFQNENGEYVENANYRKMITNAPVGEVAVLIDLDPIENYVFNENHTSNQLTTVVKNGENETLKAYYDKAIRSVIYDKGNAISGDVPADINNPYEIGELATVLGNTGNLIGSYSNQDDAQFVCWKSEAGNYYYENDQVAMNDNLKLTPVFIGDLYNDQTMLTFTSGENGKIEGQQTFAVPRNHSFGKVIKNEKLLPKTNANEGYAFDGWYVMDERIATDATSLYAYVKDINFAQQIEARFIQDDTAVHDITYRVSYYKGDTLADAMNATPEITNMNEYDVWSGIDSVEPIIQTDKYQGYVIDPTNMSSLPAMVKNGENINVYYIKDVSKWTSVTFVAGNGTLNGDVADISTTDVLIGSTFNSQNISIPEVQANSGWIFKDWNPSVNMDTTIIKDMIITAQYAEDRNRDNIPDDDQFVTVIFNAGEHGNFNRELLVTMENMLPGDSITVPTLSVDNDYEFTGYDKELYVAIPKDFSGSLLTYTAQYDEVEVDNTTPILPFPVTPDQGGGTTTPILPNQPQALTIQNPGITPAPIVPRQPIAPTPTPIVQEDNNEGNVETVKNQKTPKAKLTGNWAILNLVASIATIILAAILILLKSKEDTNKKYSTLIKAGSAVVAVASIVIFFVTQDLSLNIGIFDKWTVLMVVLIVIQVAFMLVKHMGNNTKSRIE